MYVRRIQTTQYGPPLSMKILMIEKDDPAPPCENCGKPNYNHPDLAKDDFDWCLNCNDILLKGRMTFAELGMWSIDQIQRGKIVMVGFEEGE